MRKECWEELTRLFMPGDNVTQEEREAFSRSLQRRWKNLRDCYARELVRPKKSSYLYYQQLSFLQNVIKRHKRIFPIEPVPESPNQKQPANVLLSLKGAAAALAGGASSGEDQAAPPDSTEVDESDCDRLFLMSLVKPLKDIPEDARFEVKMEIMQIIQQARLKAKHNPETNQMIQMYNMKEEVNYDAYNEQSMDSIKEPATPNLSASDDDDDDDEEEDA
ncbi:unnamed protein product [Acanthoscelides obtectus]|nr:unnamed protein product [Acanthoscelides obtectus]CAK1676847.1 hypothetical protein AOBTE_LOCUS30968 [Acanthoscelides obtectus]